MEQELITEGKYTYIEKGEGPVVVVLHGLFGALSNFKDLFDRFSGNYKVVMPVLPIYKLPILNTNIKTLAKHVAGFIESKGFTNVNLVGNSLGGHIVLAYTAKHLKNVRSMVLTGSSGLYENAFGGSFPRREDKEYLKKKIELTFYDPAMVTEALVDECHEAVNNREKVIRILSIAKSAIRHNMSNELPGMNIPTCLIWGKNDGVTPPEVAEEFKQKLPDADLFWIDQCGHAPMMEHPDEFNNIMENWYKSRNIL